MNPLVFLSEVKAEMDKVVWPTKKQALQLTALVLAISAIVAAYTGGLDYLLTTLLNKVILK